MNFTEIVTFFRSLSLGGLLGVGIAVAICVILQNFSYINYVVAFGGLIGAAFHRFFDRVLVKGLFHPIGNFIEYYGKLTQIEILRRNKIIDDKVCERIKKEKTLDYFLGEKREKQLRNQTKKKELPTEQTKSLP